MTVRRDGTGEVSPPLWKVYAMAVLLALTITAVLAPVTESFTFTLTGACAGFTAFNLSAGAWYLIQANRASRRTDRMLNELTRRWN